MLPLRSLATSSRQLTLAHLNASFPFLWLRDACQCPKCVLPSTRQKLHRFSDISSDIRPVHDGLNLKDDGIHIRWTDGHESFHSFSFLEQYSTSSRRSAFHRDIQSHPWNKSTLTSSPHLFVPYRDLSTPSRLLSAINQLTRFGLLFVTDVPSERTDNATCEIRKLASLFAEIRTTLYGELCDIKITNSHNIAFTNLDLGLHADILYYEHPPRYQIFHCLRNRVKGGTSIFSDGYHAAYTLRQTHPEDFDILSTTPVQFHYIYEGHHMHHEHPTIELEPRATSSSGERLVKYINYAPPFQAPLIPSPTFPILHSALKRFSTLVDDPTNRLEYTLREGDAVLFDNRRVLHGRTAFTDSGEGIASEPSRWLKACYIEPDAIFDKGRVLRAKIEKSI